MRFHGDLICLMATSNEIEGHAMYQPSAFREDRIEVQHALIRAHPLGLLITAGPGGLIANPFPFLLDAEASGREGPDNGTLRLHIARANPQWRELEVVEECLIVSSARRITSLRPGMRPSATPARSSRPGTMPRSTPGAVLAS
jgi:Putative FMN-binding domain